MNQSLLRPALLALIGLPFLAGCMDTTSAQDALPDDPSAYSAEIAELRDGLETLDGSGTVIPNGAVAAPTPTVVVPTGGNPTGALDTTAPDVYMITGMGFSQIRNQPGTTINQRRLMALRAARMEAIRDLTEQVHGIHINASTTIAQARLQSDTISGVVEGTIRGARTVRITPKGSDGYEVELALDADTVAYIVRAAQGAL